MGNRIPEKNPQEKKMRVQMVSKSDLKKAVWITPSLYYEAPWVLPETVFILVLVPFVMDVGITVGISLMFCESQLLDKLQ